MTDLRHPPFALAHPEPGVPVIPFLNAKGLQALYVKEVRRFFKVQLQTIWAPAITTLLFLVIFSLALGRSGRMVMGEPFANFVAPGLIVMGMIQNAFANGSFSLMVGKIQGTIVDYLMPPLSSGEVLAALVAASMTRAILVGVVIWGAMAFWPQVEPWPQHWWAVVYFGLAGVALLSLIGVLTSMWAQKFDHNATITSFVIQPLSMLSGTFYSVENFHGVFRTISHLNPFFLIISGFRYGFIGVTDGPLLGGALGLLALNGVLAVLCYRLLDRGWRLKA